MSASTLFTVPEVRAGGHPEETRALAADDPIIPAEHHLEFEREMREGGVDWTMVLYGSAQHSFTHPLASEAGIPGIAYDERAAGESWQAMAELLATVF